MIEQINLIFLGGFEYPFGMAGTKRIQHIINGLKLYSGISVRVIIIRQSSQQNVLSGTYQGIPYETLIGDLFRTKMLLMFPLLRSKARRILNRMFQSGHKNIIYIYGPPSFENLPTIQYARRLGFKTVFDIVEDDDHARDISSSIWHRLSNGYRCRATRRIASLADGIVVISSHLENKFRRLTSGTVPIHYLSISVDMGLYPDAPQRFGDPICLFYAGSFGKKDGISGLLDGFDILASKYTNVRLVMTGRGTESVMRRLYQRIGDSPHKHRIIYKGYLNDADYYAALREADILCMPRVDIRYAQAGFPFKLGEYLATGKPVIASAVSDIQTLLKDRHDVMLVMPGSGAAIAGAAEDLIQDEVNAFAIGSRGRIAARRYFDYRSQSKGLFEFLCGLA